MKDVKEITAEPFGLIIAYFIPGAVGLFSLSFWSDVVKRALETFLTSQSNINLLLLLAAAALVTGLLIAACRQVTLEKVFRRTDHLKKEEFADLLIGGKFVAFSAAINSHYRYHQCWSGLALVMPLLWAGLIKNLLRDDHYTKSIFLSFVLIALEVATILAAKGEYDNYVGRSRAILTGQKVEDKA
jgi:predicted histidine transporter YuiF (NhaC family)